MDCRLPTAAYLPITCARIGINRGVLKTCSLLCFAKNRGFGTEPTKKGKVSTKPQENVPTSSEPSKVASGVLRTRTKNAQELAGTTGGKSNDPILDRQFLEKVESVRRSAYEQKKIERETIFQPIDYDAPIASEQSKIGLATKVGVGVSVVVLGVIFAFGDSFPSGSNIPSGDNTMIEKTLSEKERSTIEETVRQFQETLNKSPKDPAALEVELLLGKAYFYWGHVSDAVAVYDQLISKYPNDFRGYLAKGIILKENGKIGDAERMFIQAKFFAPEKEKALVDSYSRQ